MAETISSHLLGVGAAAGGGFVLTLTTPARQYSTSTSFLLFNDHLTCSSNLYKYYMVPERIVDKEDSVPFSMNEYGVGWIRYSRCS